MQKVKTQQRYKCDFCKKRSVKSVMALHERRCYRNPNRFCDYCENKGFIIETNFEGFSSEVKIDCVYCSKFNPEQLEEIKTRESRLNNY